MRRTATPLFLGSALVLLGGIGGCGSDEAQPPVCDSVAAVQTTIGHIRDVNVSENGLSQLKPYLTELRDQLAQLSADARAQFGAQADQVRTGIDQLGSALRTAQAEPTAANLAGVRTAVTTVRTSWNSLRTSVAQTC